jgi:hypothetical protein
MAWPEGFRPRSISASGPFPRFDLECTPGVSIGAGWVAGCLAGEFAEGVAGRFPPKVVFRQRSFSAI